MPWPKGRPRSQETKRKLSESHKGRVPWNKGKKTGSLSEEHKQTLRKANKGQVPWNKGKRGCYSGETLRKMSEARKGRVPWNKGKETEPRSEETKQKLSVASKGNVPGNKGKPHGEEAKRKMREAHRAHTPGAAIKRSQRISLARQGCVPWNKGKPRRQETKRKLSKALKGRSVSEKQRRKLSEAGKAAWASGAFDNRAPRLPFVTYKGTQMRSAWEARLAAVFDARGWTWEYEPCQFQYNLADGPHTYTPDFYVHDTDCYYDPHHSFWDSHNPNTGKFNAVRSQHGIALVVLNEELLEAYERMVDCDGLCGN